MEPSILGENYKVLRATDDNGKEVDFQVPSNINSPVPSEL